MQLNQIILQQYHVTFSLQLRPHRIVLSFFLLLLLLYLLNFWLLLFNCYILTFIFVVYDKCSLFDSVRSSLFHFGFFWILLLLILFNIVSQVLFYFIFHLKIRYILADLTTFGRDFLFDLLYQARIVNLLNSFTNFHLNIIC